MPCKTLTASSSTREHDIVHEAVLKAKRIVILTGAGISVSAGLPDFRSKEGLYNLINSGSSDIDSDDSSERPSKRQKSNIKGQDLFSAHVFRDPVATTLFYKFISSLYKLSVSDEVKPTPTHQFISKLARRGKLVRCYTQNIDCLEDDVGLTQALDLHNSSAGSVSSNGSASKRFNGHCVQLHGRIDRVKCGCGYVGDWTGEVLEEMSEGYAPSCPGCDERADVRKSQRKRSIKQVGHMGALKPAITLYDDAPSGDEITIANISDQDLRRKPDLIIVMGTSLKIPGFKNLVKDFVYEAKQREGKKVAAVLVNATDVLSSEWKSVFDYFIMDQCDAFVKRMNTYWKRSKPDDWLQQVAFSDVSNATKVVKSSSQKKTMKKAPSTSQSESLRLLPAFEDSASPKVSSKRALKKQESSVIYMGSNAESIRTSPSSPKAPSSGRLLRSRSPSLSAPPEVFLKKPVWAWSQHYPSRK